MTLTEFLIIEGSLLFFCWLLYIVQYRKIKQLKQKYLKVRQKHKELINKYSHLKGSMYTLSSLNQSAANNCKFCVTKEVLSMNKDLQYVVRVVKKYRNKVAYAHSFKDIENKMFDELEECYDKLAKSFDDSFRETLLSNGLKTLIDIAEVCSDKDTDEFVLICDKVLTMLSRLLS